MVKFEHFDLKSNRFMNVGAMKKAQQLLGFSLVFYLSRYVGRNISPFRSISPFLEKSERYRALASERDFVF
jgi:hypothetical protein